MIDISKKIFLQDAIISFKTCIQQAYKLLTCMILDLLFFVVYGLLSAPIFNKLSDHVIVLGAFISDAMKKTGRTYVNNKSIVDMLSGQQVWPYFFKFLILLLLLGMTAYLLYCLFQGIAWKLSSELAGYKISWKEYLKSFTKVNSFWFAIFVIYYFGSLFVSIRKTIILKFNPTYAPSYIWEVIFAMVLFIFIYLMILSYVSGRIKIGLKAGIKGWKEFAPPIILIIFVFLIINEIMLRTGLINIQLAYLFGLTLFLPALTIAKVYIFRVASKLAENGILPQY